MPALRNVAELAVVFSLSTVIAWTFSTAMFSGHPMQVFLLRESPLFVFYLPSFAVTVAIFEALGPMHKSWLMLAVLIAVVVQNFVLWLLIKWGVRAMRRRRHREI